MKPRKGPAYDLVVVGCSLGGMRALQTLLGGLPKNFPLPVAIVQHRHRASAEGLPAFLRKHSNLPVVDVDDKLWVRAGSVYLAPADYHLLVERGEFTLSVDDAVSYSRPSIDVLFESAADAYATGVIGVVLTGANSDGARGVTRIKSRGGHVIAQDPANAEAPAMPQAAIDTGHVDRILRLDDIAPYLVKLCQSVETTL
jgi:two-component system chemotaxis response regulator CheB